MAYSYTTNITDIVAESSNCTVYSAFYGAFGKVAYLELTIDTVNAVSKDETLVTIVSGKRPNISAHDIDDNSMAFVYARSGVVAPKGPVAKDIRLIIRGIYLLP